MNFATVYVDESGTHEGSPALVMAGFLYEREHAELLSQEWSAVLDREKMPFLHMKDFTKPGQKPYEHLSEERKRDLSVEFVDMIQRHRTLSFATVVKEDDLTEVFADFLVPIVWRTDKKIHNNYAWALIDCLQCVMTWIERSKFDGEIAYIFESGHKDQHTANFIMEMMVSNPKYKERLRHLSHTFSTRTKDPPLQTADMYAWLSGNCAKRVVNGTLKARADWKALFENRSEHQSRALRIWNKPRLIEYAAGVAAGANGGQLSERAFAAFISRWKWE